MVDSTNLNCEMDREAEILKIQTSFGAVVKRKRKEKKISQEKLAELVDLQRTYISEVERGKRNVSLINIYRISEGLGIPLELLFKDLENEISVSHEKDS